MSRTIFVTVVKDAGANDVVMEAEVWSKMPEEVIWEVLQFVPSAKLVQWHLVSRKWRMELTSAHFLRKQQLAQSPEERVVWRSMTRSTASCPRASKQQVWEVDVTWMVPGWFWGPSAGGWELCQGEMYPHVEAAAHGLVCISNSPAVVDTLSDSSPTLLSDSFLSCSSTRTQRRYCVLDLLTGTCALLPPLVPFKAVVRWHLPDTSGGGGGAVTVLAWSDGTGWDLATCYLLPQQPAEAEAAGAAGAAGAGSGAQQSRRSDAWVVAPKHAGGVPSWMPATKCPPPVYAFQRLGGESYWYNPSTDRVHVLAPGPGGAGAGGGGHQQHVEVGALRAPSLEHLLLRLRRAGTWTHGGPSTTCSLWAPVLVAHGRALFFVSQVMDTRLSTPVSAACGVWRLVRERMEWEAVACLDWAELQRVTGAVTSASSDARIRLHGACGVRQLLCLTVDAHVMDPDSFPSFKLDWRQWVLAFNLNTAKWGLLIHNPHLLHCTMPKAMELSLRRPTSLS